MSYPIFQNRHTDKWKSAWILYPQTDTQEAKTVRVLPKNEQSYTLDEIQAMVGGYFEVVFNDEGYVVLANEDGLTQGLPLNEVATNLYGKKLVGNIVVAHWSFLGLPNFGNFK